MQFGVSWWGRGGLRGLTRALVLSAAVIPGAALAEGAFIDLGWLPGEVRSAEAYGVNGAGTIVVGASVNVAAHNQAVLWDAQGNLHNLGTLGGWHSYATGVSADGSVVAGSAQILSNDYRAFRWSAGGGMVDLGTLGGSYSYAYGLSADGSRVVGASGDATDMRRPFLWIDGATTGIPGNVQMFSLDMLAGSNDGAANAISRTGAFATGYNSAPASSEAVLWTIGAMPGGAPAVTGLGTLGGAHAEGNGVSNDGTVVAGMSFLAGGDSRAFRWTSGGGMVDLGTLGGSESAAYALSADGAVVVGMAKDAGELSRAFRWSDGEMQSVTDWLEAAGVDMGSINLISANGVSDDGQVVVGRMRSDDGEDLAFLARVTRDGAGVIDPSAYWASLYDATRLAYAGQHLSWLPMTGAHHRTLMDYPMAGDVCGWATGGFARYGAADQTVGLAEAGLCADFVDGQVRAGLGLGTSHSRQGLPLGGSAALDGRYVIGEVDYAPADTSLVLSLTGLYGGWSADFRRAYQNGAGVDLSTGTTQVQMGLVRVKAEWRDAVTLGSTGFTPWGALTLGNTHVDGFTETGGGFPAQFAAQSQVSTEARLGLTATTTLGASTILKTTLEAVHRFDATGPGVSGVVPGAFAFDLPGTSHGRTWLRAGVDIDQKLGDSAVLSLSLHGATSGQDGDVSGALGLHTGF